MAVSGYSIPETLTDDAGNALKGIVVTVTGPSSYTGTATSDAVSGILRLGPLPVGDYTVTYQGRSAVVPVVLSLPSGGADGQVVTQAGGVLSWSTPASGGVTSVAGKTGAVTLASSDLTDAGLVARRRGAWTATTVYAVGDEVLISSGNANGYGTGLWRSLVAHTSGSTFSGTSTGNWEQLAGDLASSVASATYQPLDSDLTAIAALSTTTFGRALLALADAAAGRTALGLGTAATAASGDFQPIDSDLTAIAALTTTAYGRAFLAFVDAAAAKTALALVKADVGLGNVDNTSDANKPVSTAQATLAYRKVAPSTLPMPVPSPVSGLTISTSNRAVLLRAFGTGSAGSVTFRVTASSGNISVGIYTSAAGRSSPTTRVATTGSIPCPGVGQATVTLDGTVTMTVDHWFALASDNTTAAFGATPGNNTFSAQNEYTGYSAIVDSAVPLPSSITPTVASTPQFFMVGI